MPKSKEKCYMCENKARYTCADPKCDNQVCNVHSFHIKHAIKCQDCYLRDRKIGRIKIWGTVGTLIAILIVIIILSSTGII